MEQVFRDHVIYLSGYFDLDDFFLSRPDKVCAVYVVQMKWDHRPWIQHLSHWAALLHHHLYVSLLLLFLAFFWWGESFIYSVFSVFSTWTNSSPLFLLFTADNKVPNKIYFYRSGEMSLFSIPFATQTAEMRIYGQTGRVWISDDTSQQHNPS